MFTSDFRSRTAINTYTSRCRQLTTTSTVLHHLIN